MKKLDKTIRWALCSLCFFALARLSAQQPAQYSMYMLNPMAYHNAYAGMDRSLSVSSVFRKQWTGVQGSPMTFGVNMHLPLEYLRSGIGLHVERDILGAEASTAVQLNYNYILDLGGNRRLSVGASFRAWQKSLDGSRLLTPEGNYEGGAINHNDRLLPIGRVSGMGYTGDAGLYYQDDRLEIGLTARNLSEPLVSFEADNLQQFNFIRGYFLSAQYRIDLNPDWTIIPSLLVKTDLQRWQPELSVLAQYRGQFFGGMGYRGYNAISQDALMVYVGIQIDAHWRVAYAYDLTLSALNAASSGSHEILLNYNLNKALSKEIPAKIIYNPRFL